MVDDADWFMLGRDITVDGQLCGIYDRLTFGGARNGAQTPIDNGCYLVYLRTETNGITINGACIKFFHPERDRHENTIIHFFLPHYVRQSNLVIHDGLSDSGVNDSDLQIPPGFESEPEFESDNMSDPEFECDDGSGPESDIQDPEVRRLISIEFTLYAVVIVDATAGDEYSAAIVERLSEIYHYVSANNNATSATLLSNLNHIANGIISGVDVDEIWGWIQYADIR